MRRLCSLIMMIGLVFVIFFYIKHLILMRLNKITTTCYVTASCKLIGVATSSWIKFGWWIKTKVLACGSIVFKLIYIFYVYPTSINTCRSLLRPVDVVLFGICNLRISPQYRSRFLIFGLLNLEILLLCLLLWSYLIHWFCAYSYSWFWLDFHRDLFSIICDDDATFTSSFGWGYFGMLVRGIIWS